ncbi:MAG: metallophosphoesterase family protein [Chloroflexi bacterium]|nr:metallophosphoesterase family protein [Chloroflexota bacterium]
MTTIFTADTHFGHQRTLEFSRRPFADVASMDATLIANWNSTVKPGDTVYHLGDFGTMESLNYLSQLNGKVIFLPGNYDTPEIVAVLARTCEIIQPNTVIDVEGHRLQLVHEPDEATTGEFFLFGHVHQLQMVKRNGLNVGVDCHFFRPIPLRLCYFIKTPSKTITTIMCSWKDWGKQKPPRSSRPRRFAL